MPSLKTQLNSLIEKQGFISLNEAYKVGQDLGHKQKTVERTLNPSLSPNVITVKNDKHQIIGYKWKEEIHPVAQAFLERNKTEWHPQIKQATLI